MIRADYRLKELKEMFSMDSNENDISQDKKNK
jgi:hypothetical protein